MKSKTTIYSILVIACMGIFGTTEAGNPSFENNYQLEKDFFRPVTMYHHFTLYDLECGWMTYDGYSTWEGNDCIDYCIDVTTDFCGDMNLGGLTPPIDMLDHGRITEASLVRYTKIKYGK